MRGLCGYFVCHIHLVLGFSQAIIGVISVLLCLHFDDLVQLNFEFLLSLVRLNSKVASHVDRR